MNSWCTVSLYSHFFSTIWRISYTSLFTTPLVVTTIFLLQCVMTLWCRVSERSLISSVICSVTSLQCLNLGVSSVSSLSRCVFHICSVFLGVSSLFICRPLNRVFAPGIEATFPHECISVVPISQQFGCLGEAKSVPDRWVATFISEVPLCLPNRLFPKFSD
jgi:hypothetical protein